MIELPEEGSRNQLKRFARKMQHTCFDMGEIWAVLGIIGQVLLGFVGISLFIALIVYVGLKVIMRSRK